MNKLFNKLSENTYLLFFMVSLVLSVTAFWTLGENLYLKVIFASSAGIFELGKLRTFKLWLENKKNVLLIAASVIYIGFSILAAISMTVGSMSLQADDLINKDAVSMQTKNDIIGIDKQIANLQESMISLPPTFVTLKQRYAGSIEKLMDRKESMLTLKVDKVVAKNSATAFKIISDVMGWDLESFMLVFFITFSFMLDIGTILLIPAKKEIAKQILEPNDVLDAELIKALDSFHDKEKEDLKSVAKPIKPEIMAPVVVKKTAKKKLQSSAGDPVKVSRSKVTKFAEEVHMGMGAPLKGFLNASKSVGITARQGRAIMQHLVANELAVVTGNRTYPKYNRDEFLVKVGELI